MAGIRENVARDRPAREFVCQTESHVEHLWHQGHSPVPLIRTLKNLLLLLFALQSAADGV
jgi:hypothetical protein